MFERFTEKARRTIFFARYEASVHSTSCIESEHLLLGILREFPELGQRVPVDECRARIASKFPAHESISTSVDMPLSREAQHVLSRAAEESARLGHKNIDCGHLALGLLHASTFVADLLKNYGIDSAAIEHMLAGPPPDQSPEPNPIVRRLTTLVRTSEPPLTNFSEAEAEFLVGPDRRSRKAALGHLIDCATTHLHWIARALTEPKPVFSGDPQLEWVAAVGYHTFPWHDMIALWESLNALLAHTISAIPDEKLGTMCRIGVQPPLMLSMMLESYITHCEDVMTQILTLGHRS